MYAWVHCTNRMELWDVCWGRWRRWRWRWGRGCSLVIQLGRVLGGGSLHKLPVSEIYLRRVKRGRGPELSIRRGWEGPTGEVCFYVFSFSSL